MIKEVFADSNFSWFIFPQSAEPSFILGNTSLERITLYNLFHIEHKMFLPYLIIVADAADAVSVNFSGRCNFFQI